ncbi:ATP-binding protein [Duncaniella sp.]|uniref:sensor histidine kinase n=2 Tax=Duncaniella TaxID=2518495 RepID=UPI000E834621|nr:ATP-binding protein [Duncaniella sp.]MBJ2189764.1 GHKL domain-containing protein [Muribaculaceae bacterium]HBN62418.1 ATP-binding protein [Porphyromonadaceae bacterium]
MVRNIYDIRRRGVIGFLLLSVVVVSVFLFYSDSLVKDLSQQERERMQIWADATRELVNPVNPDSQSGSNVDFLLSIIERNRTIPVLLTDETGEIIMQRNFSLPEPPDSLSLSLSDVNRSFLDKKLDELRNSPNVIEIDMGEAGKQWLYYEDSKVLRSLGFYPYVQLLVLLAFVLIVYYAVSSTKRAEQNKVWVGLSKETAHQLGTPISSLMAWMELLEESGVSPETVAEMNKDVKRLSTIASRFSKIGSRPSMEIYDINEIVSHASDYMSSRISRRIRLTLMPWHEPLIVTLSPPLTEWVMENLIKNAVDAMEGSGKIDIAIRPEKTKAIIEISDTGKGIARKNQKAIFNPGFTTKSRGWGLGLTLTKRIIEEYHGGLIYVKKSEIGVGTTFAIELPMAENGSLK